MTIIKTVKGREIVLERAVRESIEILEKLKINTEGKFQYITKRFVKIDGYSTLQQGFIFYHFESGNLFLDDLFMKYPNLSEKQFSHWHRIIDSIYFFEETEEGKSKIKELREDIESLKLIGEKCSINLHDRNFLPNFISSVVNRDLIQHPLSQKQIDLIKKYRNRYWRQLSKVMIESI